MRILILIISLFFFNLVKAQEVPAGWEKAESKYISIAYPADYVVNLYGDTKLVMNGFEPLESDIDKFKENFGIIIEELNDNKSLEDFAKDTREELESSKKNKLTIESFEPITTPAGPAYQIEYRMEMNGFQFYHYLRLFVKNNLGYSIIYTAANQRRTYHEDLIFSMFNSITLKD